MDSRALVALTAVLLVAGGASAQPFANGDVVVFFGDSITHGGRYHQYVADYYRTRFPEAKIRFVNSGIGGEEVGHHAAEELAKGVWLGFNAKTPQYRQAQAVAKRHAELRDRERILRNHHSARWAFAGRAPVDDIPAFRAWYEKELAKGAPDVKECFGKFIPGYLEYWPKYREVRAELWKDQELVRRLAKPVAHRYEIVRIGG